VGSFARGPQVMSTSAGVKQVSIACLANDTDAISLWISQGGAVNSVLDGRGNTPLHVCGAYLETLCTKMANRTATSCRGFPVNRSASSGAVDCMDILLQHGADVTRARGDGFWTPVRERSVPPAHFWFRARYSRSRACCSCMKPCTTPILARPCC
jgi:hypothetical protein